ncbi:plasmid mobilization relaxosome protein MobC [Bradyrhizobium sp. U87765 SZCCT0131]|uniref:plasmid mobilization protein n=1 Tax=unclassified Bradyrhizobium TaxID=2631580 RepID=UPI001BA85281|nr:MULTISPECIES: plasmid mobilization relaxosome protein MobC [unclassified Bradyrhizobium]MBR1216516.1 plasmid mobilization relaxosome protein MobC [Bradyrhizobium sp. U87765 SZCCT0131]MBR1259728.1 plasmid mobilization relaxosome protein MobC [Bradyrhizobium sp. U87765 SZCCT0134]MBR1305869.1 plasmid mobilization relaxosome protein MobC [Bradyrhizobium sp. U87765 SZCCT0110]MBR1322236.1 plasmid mobilization relaxosome protein MobC [Bradyrhizobium sp. U87765 SZCCT0109]MBR1350485.1 plasmid mobili
MTASDGQAENVTAPQRKIWGRPRAIQPRTRVIKLRVTPAESTAIQTSAAASRLPVAIFVRRRALGQAVTAAAAHIDIEVITHLGKIGNNLNQAARLAHEGRAPGWPADDIDALRRELNAISTALATKVGR